MLAPGEPGRDVTARAYPAEQGIARARSPLSKGRRAKFRGRDQGGAPMIRRRRAARLAPSIRRRGGAMSSTHISIDALSAPPQGRELDSRESNGVSVSLLWSKGESRIKVAAPDGQPDQSFELHVAGPEALAAFHHPFAY